MLLNKFWPRLIESDVHGRTLFDDSTLRLTERIQSARVIAIDRETQAPMDSDKKADALDFRKADVVGISVCWREDQPPPELGLDSTCPPQGPWYPSLYFPIAHAMTRALPYEVINLLRQTEARSDCVKVFHNAPFDVPMGRCRMPMWRTAWPWVDTMLMAWIYDETMPRKLKDMAEHLLGWKSLEYDQLAKIPFGSLPPGVAFPYACQDAFLTLQLFEFFNANLYPKGLELLYKMEMPLQELFFRMQEVGIPIDVHRVNAYLDACKEVRKALKERAAAALQIANPGSDPQLKKRLHELGYPVPNVQVDTLKALYRQYAELEPVLKDVLLERKFEKMETTFLKNLKEWVWADGRIHPQILQWYVDATGKTGGAKTGRSSMKQPAVQTYTNEVLSLPQDLGLPERLMTLLEEIKGEMVPAINVRSCWVAPPGWSFVKSDSSQIEPRTMAAVTGEPLLLKVYSGTEKLNVYKTVGEEAYRMAGQPKSIEKGTTDYDTFKTIVLAQGYGGGVRTVYGQCIHNDIPVDEQTVKQLFRWVQQTLPVICKSYPQVVVQEIMAFGYVESAFGRRRRFPNFSPRDHSMIRQACNFKTGQSPAFDMMKLDMLGIDQNYRQQGMQAVECGQIHDEIMTLCPDEEIDRVVEILGAHMRGPMPDVFPHKVSRDCEVFVGKDYGHLKPYKKPLIPAQAETRVEQPVQLEALDIVHAVVKDVAACQKCDLFIPSQWTKMGPMGTLSHPVAVAWVVSNPDEEDLTGGGLCTGMAGSVLRQEAYSLGVPMPPHSDQAVILPALWCAGQDSSNMTNVHIGNCRPFLERLLGVAQPKVVIALGSVAARAVLGSRETSVPTGWHQLPTGAQLMVTYHPRYLRRSPGFKPEFYSHLQAVRQYLDILKEHKLVEVTV